MIKIDFKRLIRDHVWFGYQCAYILFDPRDGKTEGTWNRSWTTDRGCLGRWKVYKKEWPVEVFILDLESEAAGHHTYSPYYGEI